MSEFQANEEFTKQHVLVMPQNQSVASGSTVTFSASDTRDFTTAVDPNSDFVHKLNSLRNPEARKLVEDFQKNVYDLLVNKVTWRINSGSSQGGSATDAESLSGSAPEQQTEAEFCKWFASTLNLKDEGANGCIPSPEVAGLGPPVLLEVDDGGQMEFNPYKLVAVIGQKLTLAAQLMGEMKDGPDNMNFPEDKGQ